MKPTKSNVKKNSYNITPYPVESELEKDFFSSSKTYIHPSTIVGPNVKVGEGVKIGPHCTIIGNVTIGSQTRIFANVCIGFGAQDIGTKKPLGKVVIGKSCEIREFVTIHAPKKENSITKIGNNCYLMNFSHVSHDTILEENVVLINNVSLGGHSHIEKNVMIMANSSTHQFCRVGRLSALAPYSPIRQDIPPFCLFAGQPAAFSGLNLVALKRNGLSSQSINALKEVTKLFFYEKLMIETIKEKLRENSLENEQYVQEFVKFIEQSKRGVSRITLSYRKNK